jgi:hypothetical protein
MHEAVFLEREDHAIAVETGAGVRDAELDDIANDQIVGGVEF